MGMKTLSLQDPRTPEIKMAFDNRHGQCSGHDGETNTEVVETTGLCQAEGITTRLGRLCVWAGSPCRDTGTLVSVGAILLCVKHLSSI